MSEKKVVLTYSGLRKLEEELQELKIKKRREIAEKIKEARAQGDISENAEYDSAKEEQAEVEARILQLEKMLQNVEIIDEEDLDTDKIMLGATVTLFDEEYNENVEYTIVGSAEADPANGKISNESLVGSALLGKSVEDFVEVDAPSGRIRFKVLAIK